MKLGDLYTSLHTGSEELKVVKTYGDKMIKLKVGKSERHILASNGRFGEPSLVLAHVSKDETKLHKIERKLWTDD